MPNESKKIPVERIRVAVSEENDRLAIQISAVVARDFYRYLKSKGVPCSEPQPAAFTVAKDKNGIEFSIASMCQMTAVGTMEDFEAWREELPFPSTLFP